MSEQKLIQIAESYNPFLAGFVQKHNADNPSGSVLHIYGLSDPNDVKVLRDHSYWVSAVPMPQGLDNLYDGESEWVDSTLAGRKGDYKTIVRGTNPAVAKFVHEKGRSNEPIQRGLCVVGSNADDHEYEVHPYGNEVLIPRYFHAITMITDAHNYSVGDIDRHSTRLVFMPSGNGLMYVFDGANVGHYMPHVLAVMEVALPDGTGGKLSIGEWIANLSFVHDHVYAGHNLFLASDRAAKGTSARVSGESAATAMIQGLQTEVNDKFGKDLEHLLL